MMLDYPDELDALWLARDESGSLAGFTTGGAGPIPIISAQAIDRDDAVFLDLLYNLPSIDEENHILHQVEGYEDIAIRGLFVYDWLDVERVSGKSGKYELIYSPRNLAKVDQLDHMLLASVPLLSGVFFEREVAIDITILVESLIRPILGKNHQ